MLGLLESGKRIWNIDETFLSDTMYVRKKWHKRGSSNSIGYKQVSPNLNLFTAIDNFGKTYLSLMQTTGDSKMFMLYLTHFAKVLEAEDPNFRENNVILIDGAPSHYAEETLAHMKGLNLPMIMTAPYSWAAAPCELWFSQLKSVELNPMGLSTGKK